MSYIDFLQDLKDRKQIVDYRVEGNDVYISPIVPVERIEIKFAISSDGDAMVSTGVDSRDGNSVM